MENTWIQIVNEIVQVVVAPLIGILSVQVVRLITKKMNSMAYESKNETLTKYILMLKDTIVDCVEATNQTFVDAIKESGEFTPENQKLAFEKTLKAVMDILSDDAKNYLSEACGDFDAYVAALIESTVKRVKEGTIV